MKFGIFFELSVPRPFTREIEHTVIANSLEQARLADELGFDVVWAVEHHFLEGYSHCSAPELFLAAVAMQTQHIRLGHGAVVTVREINHPIRAAERGAFLDQLSRGRVEFGTARSSTWTELGGFQADPDATKKEWDEFVRVIPRMWTQERFSWEGNCFSMPERAVLPKPYQQPHPPLWVTVTSPGTELDAAARGLGCLGVATASYAEQERRTKAYHQVIQSCDPVSEIVNDQVATLNFMFCNEELERATTRGMHMLGTFGMLNAHLLFTREAYPTRAYQSLGNLVPSGGGDSGDPSAGARIPEGICIGDPKRIVEVTKRWESIGVDNMNFLLNAAEVLEHEEVLESMRLFAREVMPAFPRPARKDAALPLYQQPEVQH
jgi:alkanesulfonate monooxygenase SsuD/methylene tetrahydromethanopterin reductase-like flavin-dependent oxidoreductase (luciferase family)